MSEHEHEPSWMSGVRARDALFGMPPTPYEATATWASAGIYCANRDSFYAVPAFLAGGIREYAELDGWRRSIENDERGGLLCPKCAAAAAADLLHDPL